MKARHSIKMLTHVGPSKLMLPQVKYNGFNFLKLLQLSPVYNNFLFCLCQKDVLFMQIASKIGPAQPYSYFV